MDLLYKDEVYNILGAAIEVHKELGCGFSEAVYEEAFVKELPVKNICFEQQKQLDIYYKGERLKKRYIADLICFGKIIVELKALSPIAPENEAQLLNYLKKNKMQGGANY